MAPRGISLIQFAWCRSLLCLKRLRSFFIIYIICPRLTENYVSGPQSFIILPLPLFMFVLLQSSSPQFQVSETALLCCLVFICHQFTIKFKFPNRLQRLPCHPPTICFILTPADPLGLLCDFLQPNEARSLLAFQQLWPPLLRHN